MEKIKLSPISLRDILKDNMSFWETVFEMLDYKSTDTPETRMGIIVKGYTEMCAEAREEGFE